MAFQRGHGRLVPLETYKIIGEKVRAFKLGKPAPLTDEGRRRKSEATRKQMTGKTLPESQREKIRKSLLGKKHSFERRLNESISHRGPKSHNWKGGRTVKNQTYRRGILFNDFRLSVMRRDDFTCKICGYKQGNKYDGNQYRVEVHHPIPLKKLIDTPLEKYIVDIRNGITLCPPCHRQITFA